MSTKGKMEETLRSVIQEKLGSDNGVDIAFTTDPSNDNLIIAISGLTLDKDGEVVLSKQEFEFSATVTISINGTVTAADEEIAFEPLTDWLNDLSIRVTSGWGREDITMNDWTVEETDVRHIL